MQKRKDDFNFEELVQFFMPERVSNCVKIRVKEDGEVYFSSAIVNSIRKSNAKMRADFRHSEDYKTIAIGLGRDGNFKFPKAGTIKYKEWKEILQQFGYAIPAIYLMEWKDEDNMWIGRLQEVSEAPVNKRRRT